MSFQTNTSPALAVGGRKLTLHALATGAGTSAPTSDSRNKEVAFTRTAKGVIRATFSQTGTIYPMSVQVNALHAPSNSVRVRAMVKALDTAAGTLDIDCINEALPAQLRILKAADAAANTATSEFVIADIPANCTIAAVDVLPTAGLTADNTNNAVLTVKGYNAAGGGGVTVASMTTNVASGNWTAFVPKALTLTATTADLDRVADSALTLTITKGGSGVQLPALELRITLDRHIDLTTSEKLYISVTISEMQGI